ncbi:MAG: hypothetical protein V1709_05105 [Planctomycetota bacterium]
MLNEVKSASGGKPRKKPADEMTSTEFVNEELFQVALRGGYDHEFNLVKWRLESLKPFRSATEFMKTLWNDQHLRERIVEQLRQLWIDDYVLRPDSGVVLMLALWRNAIGAGDDYWGNFFINLAEEKEKPQMNTDKHGLNGGGL